jgi:hypothetical protein
MRSTVRATCARAGGCSLVMPFAGLSLSAVTTLPACAIGGLLAFPGDGVILTVLKEELPEERVSRFWAFALGAACYAALLVLIVDQASGLQFVFKGAFANRRTCDLALS